MRAHSLRALLLDKADIFIITAASTRVGYRTMRQRDTAATMIHSKPITTKATGKMIPHQDTASRNLQTAHTTKGNSEMESKMEKAATFQIQGSTKASLKMVNLTEKAALLMPIIANTLAIGKME